MHLSMWMIESAEEQSKRILYYRSELSIERLQSHIYITNYQRLRDIKQEQNRVIWYNHTLSSHHMHLSFTHIFLLDEWQSSSKEHSFNITIMSIMSAKNHDLHDWRLKHRCIEYHQWRAEQERCIAKKQHRHAVKVYSSVTRWIEAIDSLLST